jgi:hypothetical protein
MPWASRKCEGEFITRYEDKFEVLQMTWFDVASLSSEDETLEALFDEVKDCLVKVCDNDRLASGPASFLWQAW